MSNTPIFYPNSDLDEIDLSELFTRIIHFLKEYRKKLIITFLCPALLGFLVFYYLQPKKYESELMLSSNILTESHITSITESLDNLIEEENLKEIASRLSISTAYAKLLIAIRVTDFKPAIERSQDASFKIVIQVQDTSILKGIQSGIIRYLETNRYFNTKVRQQQLFCRSIIDRITLEISSLERLKSRLITYPSDLSSKSDVILMDPSNIYSKIIDLSKELLNYKNELEFMDKIQLIEGFTVYNNPVEPKLSTSIGVGFISGFSSVLLLIIYIKLRNLSSKKGVATN